MKTKKQLVIVLALFAIFVLSGCSKKTEETKDQTNNPNKVKNQLEEQQAKINELQAFKGEQQKAEEGNKKQDETVQIQIKQATETAIADADETKKQQEKIDECKKKIKSAEGRVEDSKKHVKSEKNNLSECEDNYCKVQTNARVDNWEYDLKSAENSLKKAKDECKKYI